MWTYGNESSGMCMVTKIDEALLWHRRLVHLNFRSIKKWIFGEANVGLPGLEIDVGHVCDDC